MSILMVYKITCVYKYILLSQNKKQIKQDTFYLPYSFTHNGWINNLL